MRVALAIIWFAAVMVWDLRTDYLAWERGEALNHTSGAVVRVLLLIPCIFLASGIMQLRPFGLGFPKAWAAKLLATLMVMFFAWVLFFDGIYNQMRGFSWWFNGSVDGAGQDSLLDLFWMRIKDSEEAIIKIWGLIVSVALYWALSIKYK